MASLTFYYGTMGCSKTANALIQNFQYEQSKKNVLLIKPKTDSRDDEVDENNKTITKLKSRIGISSVVTAIGSGESIFAKCTANKPDIIIADEAQFFQEWQIDELKDLAVFDNIEVLCYGLRTDFKTNIFPGSRRLFELADNIVEIKSICECGEKALVNARFDDDNNIVLDGEQICIGGNERYKPICWRCYKKFVYDSLKNKKE